MLAGVGFVWAAAFAAYLLKLERKEALATGSKGPLDVGRHDPCQQLGGPSCFLGERFEHIAPVLIVEDIEPKLHLVGLFIRALYSSMHPASLEANRGDVALAGIAPSAFESFFESVAVDQLHPLLNPPGLLP